MVERLGINCTSWLEPRFLLVVHRLASPLELLS